MSKKQVVKKVTANKTVNKKTSNKTAVISTIDNMFDYLIAKNTVKEKSKKSNKMIIATIDKKEETKTKDKVMKYNTRYFKIECYFSQLSCRAVTNKSREYQIQSMLLKNKTVKEIFKYFLTTVTDKDALKANETIETYAIRRFKKYFSQECNNIKKLHIIDCK